MASSRLEKVGSIFSRVEGLLRSKAMRPDDRPLWWDVYRAFPPTKEPVYSQAEPTSRVRPILYKEDVLRAKFHKAGKPFGTVNLADSVNKSNCQKLLGIHSNLQSLNPDRDEESLYQESLELLEEMSALKKEWHDQSAADDEDSQPLRTGRGFRKEQSLSSQFTESRSSTENTIKNIFSD